MLNLRAGGSMADLTDVRPARRTGSGAQHRNDLIFREPRSFHRPDPGAGPQSFSNTRVRAGLNRSLQ
jgi:hypothetical protein